LLVLLATGFAGPAAAADDPQGFLYGQVTTESGKTYQGRLRWADEEAFWGDHFNGSKDELPYADDVPRGRGQRERIKIFGITVGVRGFEHGGRQLIARFGDIRQIDVHRGDRATLTMKNGTKIEVDGGSNDLGATVVVWDDSIGKIELEWERIETIEFLPTPASLAVDVRRLYGTVSTDAGDFTGFVQWDKQECLSTDKLDGDTSDGRLSIDMGQIRSIERRSRSSSRVVLRDGRELVLDGTNDVDDDNRGIFVDDPRYGRVEVSWDSFDRLEVQDPGNSGPAYGEFAPGKPLHGTVTDVDGKTHRGRLVYDIDESQTWEILNGKRRDVAYNIPFALIRSIEPRGHDASRVVLRSGEELELEGQADVGDGNAGILVFPNEGDEPTYLEWDQVSRVELD